MLAALKRYSERLERRRILTALKRYNERLEQRRIPTWIPREDLPGPKFYPNGDTKPFYGLTCIAWVDQESELFRELCALQKILRAELEQAGLGGAFAFLEPASFHMTVCDVVGSSDPIQPQRASTLIQQVQRAFKRSGRPGKVTSLIKGIGLKGTITALVRFDSRPQELKNVLAMERKIKRATGKSVREFTGHISLAYLVQHPGSDTDKIKQILLPYEERVLGEFAFSEFDLTYFTDMNTYLPILTINLENGMQIPHDLSVSENSPGVQAYSQMLRLSQALRDSGVIAGELFQASRAELEERRR